LLQVADGPLPPLATDGVIGEPLIVLSEAIGAQPLEGLQDPRVQIAPALVEQALVGDFVVKACLSGNNRAS
jgi:hypothetical protein